MGFVGFRIQVFRGRVCRNVLGFKFALRHEDSRNPTRRHGLRCSVWGKYGGLTNLRSEGQAYIHPRAVK